MILNSSSLNLLLTYLPHKCNLSVIFSTHIHGYSIESLYSNCKNYAGVILLLKTVKTGSILGAYLSGDSLSPFPPGFRGNSDSFLFRLNGTHPKKYLSIVASHQRHIDDNEKSGVNENGNSNSNNNSNSNSTSYTNEEVQYAVCTQRSIMFGGSRKFSTNALRVDDDLNACYSGINLNASYL